MNRLNLFEVNEDVLGLSDLWGRSGNLGLRVNQIGGIQEFPALVTLVTTGIMVAAQRTCAGYEAIGKEHILLHIVELLDGLLICEFPVLKLVEDFMSDLGLPISGSAAEVIEVAVEPVIDLLVDGVVVVTDLLGGLTLLQGLDLGGSAVLVCPADVQSVVAHQAAIACEDIGGEDTADDVSQVRDIIDIGKCRGNQDVPCPSLRQDLAHALYASDLGIGLMYRHGLAFLDIVTALVGRLLACLKLIKIQQAKSVLHLGQECLHDVISHNFHGLEVREVHHVQQGEVSVPELGLLLALGEEDGVEFVIHLLDQPLQGLLGLARFGGKVVLDSLSQMVVQEVGPVVEEEVLGQTSQFLAACTVELTDQVVADGQLTQQGVCPEVEFDIGDIYSLC